MFVRRGTVVVRDMTSARNRVLFSGTYINAGFILPVVSALQQVCRRRKRQIAFCQEWVIIDEAQQPATHRFMNLTLRRRYP